MEDPSDFSLRRDHSKDVQALCSRLGIAVKHVWRDQYLFNGEESGGDGTLAFVFEENRYLTLSITGDARTVRATTKQHELPEGFQISEDNYCSWKKVDLAKKDEWQQLIGSWVTGIEAEITWHVEYEERQPPGFSCWKLCFSTGDQVSFLNFDDEERIYLNEDPPEVASSYQACWVEICSIDE